MDNRLDLDMIIAREKQRDLLRQVEQDRLIRLARARRKTRDQAGRRAWARFTCGWVRLRPGERTDRGSQIQDTDLYLLQALAWMVAKE